MRAELLSLTAREKIGDGLIQKLGIPWASARSRTVAPDRRYGNHHRVGNEPTFGFGVGDGKVQIGFRRHEKHSGFDGPKCFLETVLEARRVTDIVPLPHLRLPQQVVRV